MQPLTHVKTPDEPNWFNPEFIRLKTDIDFKRLSEINLFPGIIINDHIMDHICDLIKVKNPSKKFKPDELKSEALRFLGDQPAETYGVWVYYHWSNRLIHLPDEADFIELRTNRNIYKITKEERDLLSKKRIGIIGLSVGQSVAVTLAMERICGELRLADFDTLELTNFNRIRTGLHNLGLKKVYAVAREIAEIDPFIKITCYPEGVTEENLHTFFTEGGNLDLMIEESDGLDIKILSRYKARELGIPVVMEASDRCMVDVERFDLEPERPILHGLLGHLDPNTLKNLKTSEEKIPYMLDVVGFETTSAKAKASMIEIEQTINTWPQLASAVAMGGGITADVCRRILLDEYRSSGRYHVDIEELIGDKKPESQIENLYEKLKFTNVPQLATTFAVTPVPAKIPENDLNQILEAALWAPSGGNYQPWVWVAKDGALLLYNAMDGNPVFLGYGNISSYVGFGASIENAVLQAEQLNYNTEVALFPDASTPDLIAKLTFKEGVIQEASRIELAKNIFNRHTNRNLGDRIPIPEETIEYLKQLAAGFDGARLDVFTDPQSLDELAFILGTIEQIRMLEKDGHRDFANEIRWNEEENQMYRTGIDIATMDLTESEKAGIRIAQIKPVNDLLVKWDGGGAFKKIIKKSVDAAGAIGIVTVKGFSHEDYIRGGRAMEQVWIGANIKGLAFQPLASSSFIYARLLQGNGENISELGQKRLMELRPKFEKALNIQPGHGEILIFRLSITKPANAKSIRKLKKDTFLNIA